jgi:hypothetical protein
MQLEWHAAGRRKFEAVSAAADAGSLEVLPLEVGERLADQATASQDIP